MRDEPPTSKIFRFQGINGSRMYFNRAISWTKGQWCRHISAGDDLQLRGCHGELLLLKIGHRQKILAGQPLTPPKFK